MVEEGFKTLAHKVIENWRNEQTPLNAGATEDELLTFEKRFAITRPPDFRYFYSLVNGMPDSESDKYFFSLWPLDQIAPEIARCKTLMKQRDEETKEIAKLMGGDRILGKDGVNSLCSAVFRSFHDWAPFQKEPPSVTSIKQPLEFCRIGIPFGDYLIDSYRYILCQDEEERFFVHTDFGERVAYNFGQFLQRYLSEPEKLYLWV
jgi:hypothetical protein